MNKTPLLSLGQKAGLYGLWQKSFFGLKSWLNLKRLCTVISIDMLFYFSQSFFIFENTILA